MEQVRTDGSRCNGPRDNSASGMRPDAIPKLRAGCSSHPGGTIPRRAPRLKQRAGGWRPVTPVASRRRAGSMILAETSFIQHEPFIENGNVVTDRQARD